MHTSGGSRRSTRTARSFAEEAALGGARANGSRACKTPSLIAAPEALRATGKSIASLHPGNIGKTSGAPPGKINGMRRLRSPNAVTISIHVPPEWCERADATAVEMSRPGLEMTRADILRVALAHGLELMEREVHLR